MVKPTKILQPAALPDLCTAAGDAAAKKVDNPVKKIIYGKTIFAPPTGLSL